MPRSYRSAPPSTPKSDEDAATSDELSNNSSFSFIRSVKSSSSISSPVKRVSRLFSKRRKNKQHFFELEKNIVVSPILTTQSETAQHLLEDLQKDEQQDKGRKQLLQTIKTIESKLEITANELDHSLSVSKQNWTRLKFLSYCFAIIGIASLFVDKFGDFQIITPSLGLCLVILLLFVKTQNISDLTFAQGQIDNIKILLSEAKTNQQKVAETVTSMENVEQESVNSVENETTQRIERKLDDDIGYRLNFFSGIERLDFERDVLSQIPKEKVIVFNKFYTKFMQEFDRSSTSPRNFPDRFTLLRFLQGDKYDIEKSFSRICKTIAWRELDGLDQFLDSPNWQLIDRSRVLRPRTYCGFDKNGCPLYAEKVGDFFGGSEEAYKGLSIQEWIRAYSFEICEQTSKYRSQLQSTGVYQHRVSFIGDLQGIRLLQALRMLPLLKALTKEVETHFPEFIGNIVLINAGSIIPKLFNTCKKFLDPVTTEKIKITNTDYVDLLKELYGSQAVPKEYGGDNPIVVPLCPRKIDSDFNKLHPYTPMI